jgi:heavy metal sensor kinase
MSLRLRLTVIFLTLLGGAIILFGILVYGLVSLVLLQQIDTTLVSSANQLVERLRITPLDQFDPRPIANFETTDNLLFQVWGSNGLLQLSRPTGLSNPFDASALNAGRVVLEDSQMNNTRFRVLTVPLETERRPVGVLQVAIALNLMLVIQSNLASILFLLAMLAMVLSGLAAWLTIGRTLSPLATVTQVATQITHADDLSRRIPITENRNDEVGLLIQAFNETLERLENLFTMQRRFLADVSHELRTPLTVIKGNVGLMRHVGADAESLEGIDTEVDRLTRLVGDLLLLAQAESGRVPFDMMPLELDTVLLEVFQQMRVLAGDRLHLVLDEIDQIQINGDRDRIKQVLLNLVGNAVQYTPNGGTVTLRLRKEDTRACFTVSDTGAGIPEEDLPHIFERFYRGEKSRTRSKGSGFGLGLSIAYWIVRNHNGVLEVQSQVGKGTTFTVWLPLLQK